MAPFLLLVFLCGAGAIRAPASHKCSFKGRFYLSNCCDPKDILLCTYDFCVTRVGCHVCTEVCWNVSRPGISVRPGSGDVEPDLKGFFSVAAVGGYAASLIGLGEPFSVGLLGLTILYRVDTGVPDGLRCDRPCNVSVPVWPSSLEGMRVLWEVVWGLLYRIPHMIWSAFNIFDVWLLGLVILLTLEGRWHLAIMLVLAAGLSTSNAELVGEPWDSCTCKGVTGLRHLNETTSPCLCENGLWYYDAGTPGLTSFERGGGYCPSRSVRRSGCSLWCQWGSWVTIYPPSWPNGRHSWLCNWRCWCNGRRCWITCLVDARRHWCGSCVRDCWAETADDSLTFGNCGTGPRVTANLTAFPLHYGQKSTVALATKMVLTAKLQPLWKNLNTSIMCSVIRTSVHCFSCIGLPSPPAGLWERVPGDPISDCEGVQVSTGKRTPTCPTKQRWNATVHVCPGYAFYSPAYDDGELHVAGYWQWLLAGRTIHFWFLVDFLLVYLFLMHLSGARITPFLALALWIHLRGGVFGSPTPIPGCKNKNEAIHNYTHCVQALGHAISVVGEASANYAGHWLLQGPFTGLSWIVNATSSAFNITSHALTTVGSTLSSLAESWIPLGGASHPLAPSIGSLAAAILAPCASCAPAAWFSAAPMLGWAFRYPTWHESIMALLLVLIYMRFAGVARLAALVTWKLTRNFGAVGVLVLLVLARRKTSALGYEICIPLTGEADWDWLDFSSWLLSLLFAWAVLALASLTPAMKKRKLRWYSRWAWCYSRFISWVDHTPFNGVDPLSRKASYYWLLAGLVWPNEVAVVVASYILIAVAVDLTDILLETLLLSNPDLGRLAVLCDTIAGLRSPWFLQWVLERAARRGIYLYHHQGHLSARLAQYLRELDGALEPARVTPQDCEFVRDAQRILECGRNYRGKAVVARNGDTVIIGAVRGAWELPPGFVLTAPLMLRSVGRGVWQTLVTSMMGKDKEDHTGNVLILGTAATRSMGTCVGGVVYTTFHSSNGRTLAGPTGPLNPRWWSPSDDTAVYPMPVGCRSLEICGCGARSAWVLRKDGALVHGELFPGREIRLDVAGRVADFKGASGSPILCDQGHAMGMLTAVSHRGPEVHSALFVKPWDSVPKDAQTVTDVGAPPAVPGKGNYEERSLFLPTGTGKSTIVPANYAKSGHKTLVLNPSVATVAAMGPYMKDKMGITPSIFAGHGPTAISRNTGSNLVYATYGRFLAKHKQLLDGVSVILCDECHSSDPTVLLGIGLVRSEAKKAGVNLVLFGTATPPGYATVPHKNITEAPVGTDGDIPFYGFYLKSTNYTTGRHLIFVHSKSEAERVASALTAKGVKAMFHYSGRDPTAIPTTGSLTVVATDALNTGYTGDFDTVTDCNVAVQEEVTVDLEPTFTISLRTRPATADLRAQRRGRCGRGRPGLYRYCIASSPPCGTVPSGAVWAAFDAALTWYDIQPAAAARLIGLFAECPYTGHIGVNLQDPQRVYEVLAPFALTPDVVRARNAGVGWPLLVGVQRSECKRCASGPPSNAPHWQGLVGDCAVPLLYALETQRPDRVIRSPLVDQLAAALGDSVTETSSGPILLAGLALAAAAAIADYTGTLVVVGTFDVRPGGAPRPPQSRDLPGGLSSGQPQSDGEGPPPPRRTDQLTDSQTLDALQDVMTQTSWECLDYCYRVATGTLAPKTADALESGAHWLREVCCGTNPPTSPFPGGWGVTQPLPFGHLAVKAWQTLLNNLGTAISLVTAAWAAGSSPPLACIASALLGLQSALPLDVRLPAALLAGAGGTLFGDAATGLGMAASFMLGGTVGTAGPFMFLLEVLGGYESTVVGASLAFDLFSGNASMSDLVYLIPALGSPGPAVAGFAVGFVLHLALGKAPSRAWLNRLLTLLPRSVALPQDFFLEEDVRARASELLRSLSISRSVSKLLASVGDKYITRTSGSLFWEVAATVISWFRRLLDWVTSCVKDRMPSVPVPMLTCQAAYTGPWVGTGTVTGRCGCGAAISADFEEGVRVRWHTTSYFCRGYFARGIPLNTLGTTSGPRPAPKLVGHRAIHPVGLTGYVEVLRAETGEVTITRTTEHDLTRDQLLHALRQPPYQVDGVVCSLRYSASLIAMIYGSGAVVDYEGRAITLPHTVPGDGVNPEYIGTVALEGDAVREAMAEPEVWHDTTDRFSDSVEPEELERLTLGSEVELPPLDPEGPGVVPSERTFFVASNPQGEVAIERDVETLTPPIPPVPPLAPLPTRPVVLPPPPSDSGPLGTSDYPATYSDTGSMPPLEGELRGSGASTPIFWQEPTRFSHVPTSISIESTDRSIAQGLLDSVGSSAEALAVATEVVNRSFLTPALCHEALHGSGALVASLPPPDPEVVSVASTPEPDTIHGTVAVAAQTALGTVAAALTAATGNNSGEASPVLPEPQVRVVHLTAPCFNHDGDVLCTSADITLAGVLVHAGGRFNHRHSFWVNGVRRRGTTRVASLCDTAVSVTVRCNSPSGSSCSQTSLPPDEPAARSPSPRAPRGVHISWTCCQNRSYRGFYSGNFTISDICDGFAIFPDSSHLFFHGNRVLTLETRVEELEGDQIEIQYTCRHETEPVSRCVRSYIWYGVPLRVGESRPVPVTRPIGSFMRADATRAYVTQMSEVGNRIERVTIEQTIALEDQFLMDRYNLALARAKNGGPYRGWSYEEAVAKVRPRAAAGHNVKLSVADLKTPAGRKIVEDTVQSIAGERDEHPFMLTAKSEVFFQDKKTRKPPRLLCYPSLEFRVAEKMILGDPGLVAKAVLGDAYGFQYTPQQRVKKLLSLWDEKQIPIAITVDAKCFDSTITAFDVDREAEIYAIAHEKPDLVRALHRHYKAGPMVNREGVEVGYRNCRPSGIYTTSASNSITCWIKVGAACRKIGLRNPSFLIHGDDCVIIAERGEEDPTPALRAALLEYGYDSDPVLHASLDEAESASTFLAECTAGYDRRKIYFLSTDFRKVLARATSEYGDPVASACGYTLLYPWHPLTRWVLMAQVIGLPFLRGASVDEAITCEVAGNRLTFPLKQLPSILVALHGPECLRVVSDSNKTLRETNNALQALRMRGLSWYRKRTIALRLKMIRAGGQWAKLAKALIWPPSAYIPSLEVDTFDATQLLDIMSRPYNNLEFQIGRSIRRSLTGLFVSRVCSFFGSDIPATLAERYALGLVLVGWALAGYWLLFWV
uniref:Genome polyprotein n=1 Tax=Theiler's disease-associated virus TaxID=1307119 RepID=A0A2Z4FSY1_9FLAV|nr:polyprotein [Theiler's disease-associated virus]